MGTSTAWITSLFLSLSLSLQQHRSAEALLQSALRPNQDFEESVTARNLKRQQGNTHEIHCSRERSRAAWKVIEEYLMPFVEKEGYTISSRCRLHQDNDLYRDQEQHKIRIDVNEWQCGYCKKSFYAEKYIDQHFDNRHNNLLNVSHSKCLADLCGALHCDLIISSKIQKTKCNPAAAARNRHLCESLADTCFPINKDSSTSLLHEFFMHQFCDSHSCTKPLKPFSRGGRKRTSILYVSISISTIMLLPLLYLFIYLYQRGLSSGTQDLKRISTAGGKKKPY